MSVQVPKGYKQTEVGVIPEDWDYCDLADLLKIKNGFAFSSSFFGKNGEILLTPGNFKLSGGLNFDERNTKYYSGIYNSSAVLEKEDLLVVMTDLTPDCNLLGKPAIVKNEEVILHNQRIGKILLSSEKITKLFLYWYFLSDRHSKRMKGTATGSTVRHTSSKSFYESKIFFPKDLEEQKSITKALSDADALIESLEQLIAKKRQIKQGAMQELLTGQRRLPGVSGAWVKKRLDKVCPLQRGFDLPRSRLQTGNFPVVASNGIIDFHNECKAKGPGVITGRSGTIGKVTYVEVDYWPHNTSLWVTSFNKNHPKFIYYIFLILDLDRFSSGSGVPTLNRNDIHDFEIKIPEDYQEQKEIADLLDAMEGEISTLEAKLAKARQIKQSMMQELLTGRIRLI